jgi:SAM-dependent methyltransferase
MNKFCCPGCKGVLTEGTSALVCAACNVEYPLQDGLPCFSQTEKYFGEYSKREMEAMIEYAKQNGWRNALDEYAKGQKEFVKDLVLDDRRANFSRLVNLNGSERVLDLGCGFGGVSLQLAKQVKEVFSLDASYHRVSFLNIAAQQDKITNIFPACHKDVVNLPYADEYFDLISLVGVFEYIPLSYPQYSTREAHSVFLRELYRVLKPGGVLYLGTKNRFGWQYLAGGFDHNGIRFGPVLPRLVADTISRVAHHKPYRIIVYSHREYKKLLTMAKFGDLEFYWPYPGYQHPDAMVSMNKAFDIDDKQISAIVGTGFKQGVLALLGRLGLLRYIVPHYSIVAKKF